MSEARGKYASTSPVCAACGADMVCSEHGFLPCEMCEAEGLTPSLLCSRTGCGKTEARMVTEAERKELLEQASNPQAGKFKALLKSAEGGDVAAQYSVALMYWSGDGTGQDKTAAVKWFRTAAGNGHAESQLWLGRACLRGEVVQKSAPEAVRWYREAANKKNLAAQYELAMLLYKGSGSVRQDLIEAGHWMTEAANAGLADAQYQLGLHSDGKAARYWFQKAADQGHKEASESLAQILIDEGSDPLYDKAVGIVLKSQRASISLVQRELRIGYNRAARLIDQMELAGIVSPLRSDGERDVLFTPDGKPAATKKPKEIYIPTARDKVTLILLAGMLWYFAGGFVLFLTAGMLWYFVGMVKTLQAVNQLLDGLIKNSVAAWILIANKLRIFAGLVKNYFAGLPPIPFSIKRGAVGLILTAVVLWFFAGMVRDHFAKHQPATIAAQQADTKQKTHQDAAARAGIVPDTVADAPEAQDTTPRPIIWPNHSFPGGALVTQADSPDGSQSMDEPANQPNSASESGQMAGQSIPVESTIIEPPGMRDSVAKYGTPLPRPFYPTQDEESQSIQPGQRLELKRNIGVNYGNGNGVGNNDSATGYAPKGWFGIAVQTLAPEIIHSMGLAYGQGVLISAVSNAGPAARAGMSVGDILISVDGNKVGAENVVEVISRLPAGKLVPVEVIRNDARKHLRVRVEQTP